jgi:hypothetical protein
MGAALLRELGRNLRDLLPILLVVVVFQAFVIREPMPEFERRLVGVALVLIGMTFFLRGLTMSIFPLGDTMAEWLARRGSLPLLLGFAFAIGFGSTFAEPALGAVVDQVAAAMAPGGPPGRDAGSGTVFSVGLRLLIAFAVGGALVAGVLRVVKGWSVAWFVVPGYAVAALLASISDSPLAATAFDAGAAATSAINIPLMLAIGIGLATMIRGRNPLVDGLGLVAMASIAPMIVVLLVSLVV